MCWSKRRKQRGNSCTPLWDNGKVYIAFSKVYVNEEMKRISWIRKNWLLVAGTAFVSVHIGTYLIQRAAKSSAKSGTEIKRKDLDK
uniref:Uncharacterized protein n=1 Tax=Sphaerodactylus townsendi TaxID=933632 RepID=A0ACB8GEQ4_9SAUR